MVSAAEDDESLCAITSDGTAHIAAHRVALAGALGRLRSVSDANSSGPAPEIVRATENLRLALRLRQGRGPSTTGQIHAIAPALDAAVVAIARR